MPFTYIKCHLFFFKIIIPMALVCHHISTISRPSLFH
jgi:hypothetical protein